MLEEMSPKDLAVTVWSLARLGYPASEHLTTMLQYKMTVVLSQLSEQPYLFESENDSRENDMIESEIGGEAFTLGD